VGVSAHVDRCERRCGACRAGARVPREGVRSGGGGEAYEAEGKGSRSLGAHAADARRVRL
jgi:hypothetical protein